MMNYKTVLARVKYHCYHSPIIIHSIFQDEIMQIVKAQQMVNSINPNYEYQ
jgi:hypothetical protein